MPHDRAEHVLVCFTGRWSEDVAPGLLLSWRPPRESQGWVISAEHAHDGRADPFVRRRLSVRSVSTPVSTLP